MVHLHRAKGTTMKKILVAVLAAGVLVGGSTASFAATKAPIAKPTKAAGEGTAKHEMSENSSTQKNEAKAKPMATTKPMAPAKKK